MAFAAEVSCCPEHNKDSEGFSPMNVVAKSQQGHCVRCGGWVMGYLSRLVKIGPGVEVKCPKLCDGCATANDSCWWCAAPLALRRVFEAEFVATCGTYANGQTTLPLAAFQAYLCSRGVDGAVQSRILRVRRGMRASGPARGD